MDTTTAPIRSTSQLVERWDNVARVLTAMPQHEREKHWDMSTWGKATDCGTVACAAGHCGLDPWFRERGFKLDLDSYGDAKITDVKAFFGNEGASKIFMNGAHRSVECVIDEVAAYANDMRGIAALEALIGAPAFGESWPEQGGIYGGIVRGEDGSENYALIVGPELDDRTDWHSAMAWAATIVVDDFRDFTLPTPAAQKRLFETVRWLFKPAHYWSCEQHESGSAYAWRQAFGYGRQSDWSEGNHLRARAVRRLIIR